MKQVDSNTFPQPSTDYELPPELVGVRTYSARLETEDDMWTPRRPLRCVVHVEYNSVYILGENNPPELCRVTYGS